jgi:hypothetical protein
MSAEQRIAKRHPLIMYLDILDKKTNQALGYLSDVSDTGLMFISLLPIESGMQWEIYIEIPEDFKIDTSDQQVSQIHLSLESIWAKPSLNPALFCVGCRFNEISIHDRNLLKNLSKKLGFSQEMDVNRVS